MRAIFLAAMLASTILPMRLAAQDASGGTDAGQCILHDYIYTCDSAVFQPILAKARTVTIDVHNTDAIARNQLTHLVTNKLGKTLTTSDAQPDLIFLLIPTESGVLGGSIDSPLGTLRVYSATPDGGRGHLLWAEAYSGAPDLPWPAVVHRLIEQFQTHLNIK